MRSPGTLDSTLMICSIIISPKFFSKAFCGVKTDEMEVDCYLTLVGGEGGISSYFKLIH